MERSHLIYSELKQWTGTQKAPVHYCKSVIICYLRTTLFTQPLLDRSTEFVVQGVGLGQQFLADATVVCLGTLLGSGDHFVAELIIQVHGFVDEAGNLVRILAGVDVQEQGAIVNESANHILDVFFDVS